MLLEQHEVDELKNVGLTEAEIKACQNVESLKELVFNLRKDVESSDSIFYRQVHPTSINTDGTLKRSAFEPTTKDGGETSVNNGAIWDANKSFEEYKRQGLISAGSYEIQKSWITAPIYIRYLVSNPAHCGIHFNKLEKNDKKMLLDILVKKAKKANTN